MRGFTGEKVPQWSETDPKLKERWIFAGHVAKTIWLTEGLEQWSVYMNIVWEPRWWCVLLIRPFHSLWRHNSRETARISYKPSVTLFLLRRY
jgi:hypothetical protein